MLRDLTMIFSVLVSVVSLGFGVYKNIEAGNARGFAYEQAYRVMGAVNDANIAPVAKANILNAALASLSTPPPVIDLSRSSADVTTQEQACTDTQKSVCVGLAGQLAALNATCTKSKGVAIECSKADDVKAGIDAQDCVKCFMK